MASLSRLRPGVSANDDCAVAYKLRAEHLHFNTSHRAVYAKLTNLSVLFCQFRLCFILPSLAHRFALFQVDDRHLPQGASIGQVRPALTFCPQPVLPVLKAAVSPATCTGNPGPVLTISACILGGFGCPG